MNVYILGLKRNGNPDIYMINNTDFERKNACIRVIEPSSDRKMGQSSGEIKGVSMEQSFKAAECSAEKPA